MEHEMILLDADFRSVCARMTAKRKKEDAGVAQVVEHSPRKREVETSSVSASTSEHDH